MMIQPMIRLSRWLAGNASLFIIAIAVMTFLLPELFVWVRGTTQTVILGIIMLTALMLSFLLWQKAKTYENL